MAKRKSLREMVERYCSLCAAFNQRSLMQRDRPKQDHYYCTSCGMVEVDWPPIFGRVRAVFLRKYRTAKSRLAALPAAPTTHYERHLDTLLPAPRVDGGLALSQQEAHVESEAYDSWVVRVVESTFKHSLNTKQKNVIMALYFEDCTYREVSEKLQIAKSTVEEWEKEALKEFAKTARWA